MKELVDDYSMNKTYTSMPDPPGNSSIVNSDDTYDFVIITNETFVNAKRPPGIRGWGWKTFQDLAEYKNNTGIKTKIVTVENIMSDPAYYGNNDTWGDGDDEIFNDTQCRIRNFIKHAYIAWDAEYFLLGGDNISDKGNELLPVRNLWFKWKHSLGGKYYSGMLPSDMYYACLNGSFNEDKDDIWGEPWDGAPSGDFEEPPPREPPYSTGNFYIEADPFQYDVEYDVGLFTPPLNLSGYSSFNVWLTQYFTRKDKETAQVRVYSNGTDLDTNLEQIFNIDEAAGVFFTDDINLDDFNNSSKIYVEFYYKNSGGYKGRSLNIDIIHIKGDDETILLEDFEGPWLTPTVPAANWSQKKYNQSEGNWTKEYYHIDVDLFGEVFIGRAPVGNEIEVSNFVYKTLAYENISTHSRNIKKVLLVSGRLSIYEHGNVYCDKVNEEIPGTYKIRRNLSDIFLNYNVSGYPIYDYYSPGQLIRKLNSNFHIIYDEDHGISDAIIRQNFWPIPPEYFLRFYKSYVYFLINMKPFFMYGAPCNIGAFDKEDCLAEYLTVKNRRGAFATIMYSRKSFSEEKLTNGMYCSQWFFHTLFDDDLKYYELGKANQFSKHSDIEMIKSEKTDHKLRLMVYERNLFGDPTVSIKLPNSNTVPIKPYIQEYSISNKIGNLYKYKFSANTTDSEGDQVSYKWKWNDHECLSWSKYYNSEENVSKTLWLPPGTHQIRVKVRDINLNESIWSDPLPVTVSFDSNIQTASTTAVLGKEIQFSGLASGGTKPYGSWYYDFGDGNNSQQQNTTHTYNTLGSYNVTLNVTDSENISSNSSIVINTVILNSDFESAPGPASSDLQETFFFTDKSKGYYDIVNWSWDFGDGNMSFQRNSSHEYSCYGAYNVTLNVTDNQSNTDAFYQIIYIDLVSPTITSVESDLDVVGYGTNITISFNTSDSLCGIKTVNVNITCPDNSSGNDTMNNTFGSVYEYVFSDCWQLGEYSYNVWVVDNANNSNCSSDHSFVVSRMYGYNKIGGSNQTIWDTITGSVFRVNEKAVADNISVYLDPGNATSDYHYSCVIYSHNGSELVGVSEEKNISCIKGWQTFNFSVPKPVLLNDTDYVIGCWSNNSNITMYYDNGTGSEEYYDDGNCTLQGHFFEGFYGYSPDPICFDHEDRKYSIYCCYTPDNTTPVITNVSDSPGTVGFGFNVTISADVSDNQSGVEIVKVNITYPNSTEYSFNMNNGGNDSYEYVFNNSWLKGQYNYSIWVVDYMNHSNSSSVYSFSVSAQATMSVCTIKDEYVGNETVNLTDPPPGFPEIGYDLLDDGKVLRIWNRFDSYYFNTSSGIQMTNHYDEYWSHNVLMLGYYSDDVWNLIYRTDELSGFNKNITSNEGYVNATLWKNLSYEGYDFRLAIRYHLGVDYNELSVIPYIKNIDDEDIPYVLGFAWEIKDIQIDMTTSGDYIKINGTTYLLNQSLDETYNNMDNACFYIKEDYVGDRSESLYLRWNKNLSYMVKVESREGQYNAPVTLGIKIGTLDIGQEKHTSLFWHDLSEVIYYFNSYDNNEPWATSPGNMVDGSTSNYASTTTNGDIELCDSNNCSTSDLGVISKVELRSYGYYSTNLRLIYLRPVFSGTTDGLNYPQPITSTPGWSDWVDITNDPYAPNTWSWSDVENLDCDVEAGSGFGIFTLYCSKVEIRVSYVPNNDPVISNPVPADDSTGVTIAPMLNITVSDLDGDSMNITWLSNSSGSWVAFGTNNSVGNGTYHQTMSNASVNGAWGYWKVNVTDGTDSVESSVFSFYTGYQSKIKNTGSTNFSGYLLMQVQFYDEVLEDWFLVVEPTNETTPRTIVVGGELGLDTIFNGRVETSVLLSEHGNGTYRVYACFRDPDGDVLVCDDDTLMSDTFEFTLTDN
jgi:PKD repeat protein